MPAASRHAVSRHAKPRPPATRLAAPIGAATAIAGVTVAIVVLQGGSAPARPASHVAAAVSTTSTGPGLTDAQISSVLHSKAAAVETAAIRRAAAQRQHRAALAAARHAQQAAAQASAQAAAQASATPTPAPAPSSSPSPAPTLSSGGGNAAGSPLGICIRNAEEGGSYAWGPGNGGGAYQFALGTWEHYGGAADEFGVAGPGYQDQIFDNAIAAGGASNWTDYDGC